MTNKLMRRTDDTDSSAKREGGRNKEPNASWRFACVSIFQSAEKRKHGVNNDKSITCLNNSVLMALLRI